LKNKTTSLPFKKSASGYMYLEYATSLRMSDLGYTNSEQSSLQICYNDLDGYLDGVQNAINLPSEQFAELGIKVNGKYQQLNSNILQIENELYAPIRPKQVAKSGEKPSEALRNRGVEYIEVRALDVNPFSDTGISIEQVYFLDIFITYCALAESALFTCEQQKICDANMDQVVVRGRDPQLLLNDNGSEKSVKEWGAEIFAKMHQVATLLDSAYGGDKYCQALANEQKKITDPNLTPSAILLDCVVSQGKSLTEIALKQAQDYRHKLLDKDYQVYSERYFTEAAMKSHQEQKEIERSDKQDFDTFLADYFAK
jgi:glutamate--cysteine ligase